MNAVLVDTNILIYAHDPNNSKKQDQSISVLEALKLSGNGVLSVQSLGEFYVVSTRKTRPLLTENQASNVIRQFINSWRILEITPMIVLEALRGKQRYQLPYWDAQLWATARLNQITVILTEDFNSNAVLDGVRFLNPFEKGFSF